MDHSHAALVAEDDLQASLPLGLSPARWFWYSSQRADAFAFATTKGTKKPKKKGSGKYGTAGRRVLDALSSFANTSGESWPSVPTLARLADCSERTVQRALDKLSGDDGPVCKLGRSGAKYRNTFVYALRARQMSPN